MSNPTENIIQEAEKWENTLSEKNQMAEFTKVVSDSDADSGGDEEEDKEDGKKIKYIRTPNFTDCGSANTQLPINVANETISILSKYRSEFDFVDFIKEKLNYNSRVAVCMNFFSEQIDALVLAIKQFESNRALILGDMAGIGKGRVVAGILRYAYQQKIIPVFITEKENLYSEMFKDIMEIGGFGGGGGSIIEPRPFIMNPRKSDGSNILKDNNDNEYETTQPLSTKELNQILAEAAKNRAKNMNVFPFIKKGKGYDFNCIFLTYNVISLTRGESGDNKRYFLYEVAKNAIFVLDECHNASGESKLGEWTKQYVTEAKGVMFSSATFAKNPQSYPLYIIKTAMSEAQIDITDIENAIGVGGENVSEYISSVLVKEGQMIRRERDFSGCTLGTIYEGYEKSGEQAELAKERIYRVFNESVNQFRKIYNYIKERDFKNAIKSAIIRKADEEDFILAPQDEYLRAKKGKGEAKETERRDFVTRYRNRWVIQKYETNTLGATTKFHFADNLLLSIKAKFVADAVIKELQSQVEYPNLDGESKKTNRKPVIALRATGENLFRKMNVKTGGFISNDFAEYIRAVVSGVMEGKVTFRKVNNDLFLSNSTMEQQERQYIEETKIFNIINEDLSDNGAVLNNLLSEVNTYTTDVDGTGEPLPLSNIDYLIDKIQSVQRKSWDLAYDFTSSLNYKVNEVTGRNYALKNQGDGRWMLTTNERERSVKSAFNQFNSGKVDVLIINESGSTGGSIHSSETFKDQRQRIMFITQVELDVNTEVQKRGRINRSGQVNYPAYLYVLSQVPSEIRKYLALARKLRRLDANVAANQTQNSNLVSIKDKRGKKIKDFFNIYGEEAFQRFINNEDNLDYRRIYDAMMANFATEAYGEVYAQDGNMTKALLQSFTRELEIYPCDMQEFFYDSMNVVYESVVAEHKQAGTFQLELDIEDLKASLRTRLVRQLNNGLTEFSKPLFIEDKYCLERRRIWSKEKLEREIVKMASNFYKDRDDEFTTVNAFHRHFVDDFENTYESFIQEQTERFRRSNEPQRDIYSNEEDYNEALNKYQDGLDSLLNILEIDRSLIRELIEYYIPNRPIMFADIVGIGDETNTVYRQAKFVGYSLKATSQYNKYSKGAIHFKFAFMGGSNPTAELTLSRPDNITCLQESKRHSNITFSATTKYGDKTAGDIATEKINKWEVNTNIRKVVRFLSGNILSGIQMANKMEEISRWSLVKYTNADGTISTSIRLDYPKDEFEPLTQTPKDGREVTARGTIQVTINNPNIIQFLKDTPTDYMFLVAVNTYRSRNVEPVNSGAAELMVNGLIKIGKPSNNMNKIYINVFQGTPSLKGVKNAEVRNKIISNTPYKNASNVNNPIFFAPFLNDFEIYQNKVYDKDASPFYLSNPSFPNGFKNVSGNSKIYEFDNIDTEEGANLLLRFLEGLYEEQPISLEFPQNINDYYNVSYQPDIPPKEKGEEKKTVKLFEQGEYKYKLEVNFDDRYQKSLPPLFLGYEKGKDVFDKGYIILEQPLLPTYASSYKIYPVNLSNEDTIKLLLSIFQSEERADFINTLTQKAEADESVNKIGDYVNEMAIRNSVPDTKYIFGKRRTNDIGELLKTYALKGDIEKLEFEYVEEAEPEKIKVKKKTLESPTSYQDVEKFLNLLLF